MVRRLVVLAFAACAPELDEPARLGVLAIRSEPAEVAPGQPVTYAVLATTEGAPTWAFCSEAKPLAELGPVSPRCFGALPAFATGRVVSGVVPADACRRFGPEGDPAARPVDADATGGFYQPVRVGLGSEVALERTRVACGLGTAVSAEVLADFRTRYRANVNPEVQDLTVGPVRRGERAALRVTWAECTAPGCTGREPYLAFDPKAAALVTREETMTVAWTATAGRLDAATTGGVSASDNGWTAPAAPGEARLFAVLRDDRGGSGWREVVVRVE